MSHRYESDMAVGVMEKYCLKVNTPTPEQIDVWHQLIKYMSPDFRGTVMTEKAFDRLMVIKKEMESH